jgi:hypothetical protein
LAYFRLKAGAHTTGAGADIRFFRAGDPKANIVESDEDLASLEPARWEPYDGPVPGAEEEQEPEEPPPPPAGDAEYAAARALEAQLRPGAAEGAGGGTRERRPAGRAELAVPTAAELEGMTVDELRALADKEKVDLKDATLKADIVRTLHAGLKRRQR